MFNLLEQLKKEVLKSNEIEDVEKGNFAADIETVKNQVAKTKPNIDIIKMSWASLGALANFEGLIQLYERLKPMIEALVS